MTRTSLIISGLVLGAATAFVVRAVGQPDSVAPIEATAAGPLRSVATGSGAGLSSAADPTNAICPVMGNPVDPGIYVDHGGRRIWFCCRGCDETFLEDSAKYLAILDEASAPTDEIASQELATGTEEPANDTCPVLARPVDPGVYVDYEGRRIWFCCRGCDETFLKDPERYLAVLDAGTPSEKEGR